MMNDNFAKRVPFLVTTSGDEAIAKVVHGFEEVMLMVSNFFAAPHMSTDPDDYDGWKYSRGKRFQIIFSLPQGLRYCVVQRITHGLGKELGTEE